MNGLDRRYIIVVITWFVESDITETVPGSGLAVLPLPVLGLTERNFGVLSTHRCLTVWLTRGVEILDGYPPTSYRYSQMCVVCKG
jgi:hypothetical protein